MEKKKKKSHLSKKKNKPALEKILVSRQSKSDLFLSKSQQLLLGLRHLLSRASDGDLVDPRAFGGEVNVDTTAFLHDRADKAAFGAN